MHDLDETFETDPPSSMDVDETQTADPSEIKPTSQDDEALEGDEAATVDCEQHAKLDNNFGDLAADTEVNEDTDDAECHETATESVKETPVEDFDALAFDNKPETCPDDDFGDFSSSGVTQKSADSEKGGVSDNGTPFEDADSSVSEQERSSDDDGGYLSAVDAISTGFNEESNAEDDKVSNNGEAKTTNEEKVPKNEPGAITDDDFGNFFGEDANVRSEESDNDVLHSIEKSTLAGKYEDLERTHEPSQKEGFSSFSAQPIGDDEGLIIKEESNVENDEAANDGEMDKTNEGGVPDSEPDTLMDDDFGDLSGEGANIQSEESGNDVLDSIEKSALPANSEDPEVTHEPSQEDTFSSLSSKPIGDVNELIMDATENDESAVLANKGMDGDAILDKASGSEQIDLKQPAWSHAIEDEMQVDAAQNTSEAFPADVVDEQQEDFGDFSTFNEAEPSGSQSVATPLTRVDHQAHLHSDDDDDFGDFGSCEQAKDPNQSSKVGRAEKLEQTVVLEPPEQAGQDDDDDDFGDFGDFTAFAEDPASQDVGGPGASDVTAPVSRSIGDPSIRTERFSSTTEVVDPIVQRAESVFLDVFGQAVEGCDGVEAGRDASARVFFSVHSVLSSLDVSSGDDGPSSWYTDALSAVLRGADHMGNDGPVAIVNERSEYPYAHFMVPTGLPSSEVEIQGGNPRRRDLVQKVKFSSFSGPQHAQEPTWNEVTSFPTEPPSSQVEPQSISGTVVSLPPLKSDANVSTEKGIEATDFAANFETSHAHSNGKKETLSATAKQFLQQIPDLSFMLKPTLSLPKKK